jgi:molybdopterin-containing oxidoreductase family membrane subunit
MSSKSTDAANENLRQGPEIVDYKDQIEQDVLVAMKKPTLLFWFGLGLACAFVLWGAVSWTTQIMRGMGMAGINNPVGWGAYITDFVFWVGIAHSGTLISAVLFLFKAKFRSRFNRTAEAMTIFAVMTAGLFPLIHLGRVWFFYWLFPYPNQRMLWVNFRSPLIWDVFAVSTYFTVSAVFWYVGMIPDLAIVRRFRTGVVQRVFDVLSLGWTGTFRQWQHYNQLYKFLAAFATPLVISVHSVVSWDFAMSVIPGWHTTIFAPYFVAGAIFSGTAMVITLVVPMRKMFRLEKYISIDDFDKLAKILLFTSMIVGYAYIVEYTIAFWSGNVFESSQFIYRAVGEYKYFYWLMITCNVFIPLTLFINKLRRNISYLFILSLFVNVGMWFERFNIIVMSLAHDYDPYNWGFYVPSWVELGITFGSFGWFFMFFLLFAKTLPIISMTELKEEVE